MKSKSLAIVGGLMAAFVLVAPVAAESPAPAAPPAAATGAAPAKPTAKRDACRATVRDEKLKGQDRMDSMQVCMMQARLDCLKEAIAKKITDNEKRRDYVKTCVTE